MILRIYWNPRGHNTFDYFIYDDVTGNKIVIADYEMILKLTHLFYKHDLTKEVQEYYTMGANSVVVFT
jgi:hypothetical protein